MARIVQDVGTRVASRQASIVNTFTRPAAPRDYSTAGKSVMDALGIASRKAEEEREKKEAQEKQRGKLEGIRLSAKEDGAKIREGMYPNASESFMAGLRESAAQGSAYKTVTEWKAEYKALVQENPEVDTDPTAFQTWLSQKMDSAVASVGDDEFAAAGAVPVLRMGVANMLQHHVSSSAERVEAREFEALDSIVTGKAETHEWSDDPDGEKLIASIAHEADIRVGKGLNGRQVNNTVVDSLVNVARASNDTAYLQALITGHKKGIYKLNSEQFALVETAEDQVLAEAARTESAEETRRKAQKKAAEDAAMAQYGSALADNPEIMPDKAILRSNPDLYKSMLNVRTAILKAEEVDDPAADMQAQQELFMQAYSPGMKRLSFVERMNKINSYIASSNTIFTASTLSRVYQQLSRDATAGSAMRDAAMKESWSMYHSFLRSGLTSFQGAALTRDEYMPIESEMEARYRQYIGSEELALEAAGRSVAELTRAEKEDLAQRAVQYAAKTTLLSGNLEDKGLSEHTTNKFLKFIGMAPLTNEQSAESTASGFSADELASEFEQEDTPQEVIDNADPENLRYPDQTTDPRVAPVVNIPEEIPTDTVGDNFEVAMNTLAGRREALEREIFGVEVNSWITQQFQDLMDFLTSSPEGEAQDAVLDRNEFQRRNEELQEKIKERYPENMDKVRQMGDRLEAAIFGE